MKFIRSLIENLKTRYNVEMILVENMPNKEALEFYKQGDLVIDQVLAGWYGGFAVEAMKMGKPVGVYIREEDLQFIPEEMAKDLRETVININPSKRIGRISPKSAVTSPQK